MKGKDFFEHYNSILKEASKWIDIKGREYTTGENEKEQLQNAKNVLGIVNSMNMEKILPTTFGIYLVFMLKHFFSIMSYAKDVYINKKIPETSEPIEGRFADIINYMILLSASIKEEEEKIKKEKQNES